MRSLPLLAVFLMPLCHPLVAQGCTAIRGSGNQVLTQVTTPGCPDGKTLFFEADDGVHGGELWKTDGTAAGTVMVKDINPGPGASDPAGFTPVLRGTQVVTVFRAISPRLGYELWVTDGTTAGTQLLKDISRGLSSLPWEFTRCGNQVFFSAADRTHGIELWVTDGTPNGTRMVKDINPRFLSSNPNRMICCKGRVFFQATEQASGRELWVSDGTAAGTRLVKDIQVGSASSIPGGLLCVGDRVVFVAGDAAHGRELWVTDGTSAGTTVLDLRPGPLGSGPQDLVRRDGLVYFTANDGSGRGREIFVTDLTPAGTTLFYDVPPTNSGSDPKELTWSGDKLFFSAAADQAIGRELYLKNGVAGLVRDIFPGRNASQPEDFVPAGGGVYFVATDGNGRELFFSDGTRSGTVQVCDIHPGRTSSRARDVMVCNGKVYVTADDPNGPNQLHVVQARRATVEVLGNGCGGVQPTLTATDPVIGTTVKLAGRCAPPRGGRILIVGLSGGAAAVPGLHAAGCLVWFDVRLPTILLAHPGGANWSSMLPLANSSALVGAQVAVQAAYDPAPLSLSNGLQLTIGTR